MLQTLSCYGLSFTIFIALWKLIPRFLLNFISPIFIIGSTCYFCCLLARILDRLLPRRRVSPLNKAVLITGCDTGFGHLLAKRLDSKGYKVFAGCLLPKGPDAERLSNSTSSSLSVIGLDVASDESVQNALKTVKEELGNAKLWAIVNNAGIILRGEAEWTPFEYYKRQFEVNTFGVVRVTQTFLPLLRKSQGRVVATTSFAGRYTIAGQVPYSMSKHAANSFCDGLRLEMEKWNVKVITVEPLTFRTSMTEAKHVAEGADDTWSKVPEEVKESYGAQYIEAYKKTTVKFYNFVACDNTDKVVACLEEAVTACSPHYWYSPGHVKCIVGFWFLQRLPPTITNKIMTTFVMFNAETEACIRKRIREMKLERKMS